jgi:hypothetical protein
MESPPTVASRIDQVAFNFTGFQTPASVSPALRQISAVQKRGLITGLKQVER